MTPVEKVLSALRAVGHEPKGNGRDWQARCPAHDDRNPSLSIAEGDDGKALLQCHADCATEAVVAALGLTMADLMPDRPGTPSPKLRRQKPARKTYATAHEAVAELERRHGPKSAWWTYADAKGEPLGVVVRWDLPEIDPETGKPGKPGKDIRPVARIGAGWIIGAMPAPRPLYRLPDLAAAKRAYVCEGEKAGDAARSIGLTATTSAGGSKSPHKAAWAPLAGKEAVILPDNDPGGGKYAEAVAGILAKLTPTPTVKIVTLPDLPPKGDMAEFVAARRAAGLDDARIRAEVEALADAAEPVRPERPRPTVEPFRPFPTDALPEPIRGFVNVGAKAIGCDPSYIALPLLSALASAIGNTRRIELKRGWAEPAIVWTVIACDSGTMKSPALELALRPVRRRQHDAMREHVEVLKAYEAEKLHYERDLAQWKRTKEDGPPPAEPTAPVADRCWCDDTTVEALAVLLLNQWRGLLMVRDELSGWVCGFDRYARGKGGDVAKWLEMHGGRPIIVDRKTAGTLYVPRAAVSVAGGIQPETLKRVLGREYFQNGLAARLLLTCPPRRPKRWTEADIAPEAEAAVAVVFDRLYGLEPALDDTGEPQPVIVKLTPEGKAAWIDFYNAHAEEQAELTGDLSAAWSKLEGYAARLALVVHFVRWAAGDPTLAAPEAVDKASIRAGVVLSRWFGREARRVYAMLGESDQDRDRRRLVELIERKGGWATPRDLMRSSRSYSTAPQAEAALAELVEAGLGRWEDAPTTAKGGRPTRRLGLVDPVDVDETPTNPREKGGCVNVNAASAADEDLRHARDERAAICEIDGGLAAEEAEQVAEKESQNMLHF